MSGTLPGIITHPILIWIIEIECSFSIDFRFRIEMVIPLIKIVIHSRDLPAELEEGSWLVEGTSDGWLGSSISPCETTGSSDTSALDLE